MLDRKDLEAFHSTVLASMCRRVANVCADQNVIAQGRELETQWIWLQQIPLTLSLKALKERDVQLWDVRQRMLEFLGGRDEVELTKAVSAP